MFLNMKLLLYAGFQGGMPYSLGGWAGNFTKDQSYSVGAGYTQRPLSARCRLCERAQSVKIRWMVITVLFITEMVLAQVLVLKS